MGKIKSVVLIMGAGLFVSLNLLQAQSDSIVQVAAESQGLSQVAPENVPAYGTFWWVESGGIAVPTPFPPPDVSQPIYQIADGQFLVDQTGGQIMVNTHRLGLQAATTTVASAVAAQADAIVTLINQVQAADDERQTRTMLRSMGMDDFSSDDEEDDLPSYGNTYTIDTNGLWLEITNVSNGWSCLNLHNATNQVYAVESASVLAGGWNVEMELWPSGDQTNVMPFSIQNFDRQDLYFRCEDWTGVMTNGLFCWWTWLYYGDLSETATTLDANGNTLGYDYTNGLVPVAFSFSGVEVANNYVNASSAPAQLAVSGSPYYLAICVDDTNYASDANWQVFTGTNITINLGTTEGWHEVWIGLRGHADDPTSAGWQRKRLKLDWTPPALFITNPTNTTVDIPMIQLQGFSPEALSSISYDLTNAAGSVTNQQILVLNQYYDTTTWEFTTNTWQAFDVVLTNGVNTFTLHATDLAGNITTLVTNFTLDYSGATNPPSVQVAWPTNGTEVSGNSFTVDGQVADATVTVAATITDTNGDSNTVNSLVERTGKFWVENMPLNSGTNTVTLTVTDAAGNRTTNSFNVVQNAVTLTVDAVGDPQQLWQPTVSLTGTISDDSYAVWVNGVKGTNNGDGTWSASNVPVNSGGTASFTATGYAPNERQPDGSYGN